MIKQIIAIGGGGFGRNPGQGIIESYILNQAKNKCPNICFIPTATGDNEAYKVNFYATFSKLQCHPTHLDFFKRTPDLKELIKSQDIIFVGGGNTKSMLAVWKDWGLDMLLKEAYESGIIMSGVSAGAICWFDEGVTDSWSDSLRLMDCLGFVKGGCCPHFDEEPERRPFLNKSIKEKSLESCNAIEGGCALHFIDGKVKQAVSFNEGKNSYLMHMKGNNLKEKTYPRISI